MPFPASILKWLSSWKMSDINITCEEDPVPIVKVLAAQFQRSTHHPKFQRAASQTRGVFALASTTDPQCLTISVNRGEIFLQRGRSEHADLTIHTNLFDPNVKPTIDGLWRHPRLALHADALLAEYPLSRDDTLAHFWSVCSGYPDIPRAIGFHSTTDGSVKMMGTQETDIHFYGSDAALIKAFGGTAVLIECLLRGTVQGSCSLEVAARLSEVTKDMLLGQARC